MIEEKAVPVGNDVNAMANEVRLDLRLEGMPVKGSAKYKAMLDSLVDMANQERTGTGAGFVSLVCQEAAKALADMEEPGVATVSCPVLARDVWLPAFLDVKERLEGVSVKATVSQHEPWVEIEDDEAEPGYWNHVEVTLDAHDNVSIVLGHHDGVSEGLAASHVVEDLRLETLADLKTVAMELADEEAEKRRVAERKQSVLEIDKATGGPQASLMDKKQLERG